MTKDSSNTISDPVEESTTPPPMADRFALEIAAQTLANGERYREAEALIRRIETKHGSSPHRTLLRVDLLLQAGDVDAARSIATDGLQARLPGIPGIIEGKVSHRLGDETAARRCYQRVFVDTDSGDETRARSVLELCAVPAGSRGGLLRQRRLLIDWGPVIARRCSTTEIARAQVRQARVARHLGDLPSAIGHLEVALTAARESDSHRALADCHREGARMQFELGDLTAENVHLEEVLRLNQETDPHMGALRVTLATNAGQSGRLVQALREINTQQALAERTGDAVLARHSLSGLAECTLLAGDVKSASGLAEKAIAAHREARDLDSEARALLTASTSAFEENKPAEATALAESGLRCLESPASNRLRLRLLTILARATLSARGLTALPRLLSEIDRLSDRVGGEHVPPEVDLLLAFCSLAETDTHTAATRFERAFSNAYTESRTILTSTIAAHALNQVAEELESNARTRMIQQMTRVFCSPVIEPRRRLLGVDRWLGPLEPEHPCKESLVRLDQLLRNQGDSVDGLLGALNLAAERVPMDRAAFLGDDGEGLRVLATFVRSDANSTPAGSFAAALSVAATVRQIGGEVRLASVDSELATMGTLPTPDWAIGAVVAVPARNGGVLYAERQAGVQPFTADEAAYLGAVAERMGLAPGDPDAARREPRPRPADHLGIIGISAATEVVRSELHALAAYDIPVFLHGESGTGKELAARALHQLSKRSSGPFVPVNCAAVTESLLETELFGAVKGAFSGAHADREGLLPRADGGVLFLDEVAELSPGFQAKLLRVVEQGEYRPVGSSTLCRVDVRFLSATNRDVEAMVRNGQFREDLYYRLFATATIELPPLRNRIGDLPLLTAAILEREAARYERPPLRFDREAFAAMERYRFPGNIRELERLLVGLTARCRDGVVKLEDLPDSIRMPAGHRSVSALAEARTAFERSYVRELLTRHRGNRTHAARTAGVARQTLVALVKKLGLDRDMASPVLEEASVAEKGPGQSHAPSPGISP